MFIQEHSALKRINRVWNFWELNWYSFADEGTEMATDYKLGAVDTLWLGCGLYWRAHIPLCLNFPASSRSACDAWLANLAGWNRWEVNGFCKFELIATKSFSDTLQKRHEHNNLSFEMRNNNRCCYAFVEGLGRELITVLKRQYADLQLSSQSGKKTKIPTISMFSQLYTLLV